MGNHMNTLEQIKRETRDDARLYACIRDLYDQGVSLSDLKALIPDIRRTREQLQLKRMLQNNNEVLMAMFSQEMSFLLDAKERHEELEFKKLDQLIRQQQSFRKASAEAFLKDCCWRISWSSFLNSSSSWRSFASRRNVISWLNMLRSTSLLFCSMRFN